jgi:hypothetical protein
MVIQNETSDRDSQALEFKSGVDNEHPDCLVYEELYLLLEKKGNRVIYLTTLSHKYLYHDGVFNSNFYKQYIPINQIDYIYLGYYDNQKLRFYDPHGRSYAQNIVFYYKKNAELLEITNVTNDYALEDDRIANPLVTVNKVFDLNFKFQKEQTRKLVYQEVDARNKPLQGKTYITALHENGKDVYFELDTELPSKYKVFEDRVRLTYPLPE